jgi:hypothetical protein
VEDINTLEEVGVLLIVLQSVVFGATKDWFTVHVITECMVPSLWYIDKVRIYLGSLVPDHCWMYCVTALRSLVTGTVYIFCSLFNLKWNTKYVITVANTVCSFKHSCKLTDAFEWRDPLVVTTWWIFSW